MKIIQVSDIHWRGIQRHQEYTAAFELLFKQLKEEKPDIIVCTGDVFHTKTQGITPEVIDKLVWMFNGLAEIAPVHTILGNHDGNLANDCRQDVLSPIIEAINNPRIQLHKKSGVYTDPTRFVLVDGVQVPVSFCVFSCFDKEGWKNVVPNKNHINIALFHGSVSGCQTDTMWRLKEGEVTDFFFTGYDFAMLGDIHKQQFLGQRMSNGGLKPWIGYPGSLIQQNYGEETVKGYYLWEIESKTNWDVKFIELENLAPFLTVDWKGTVQDTVGFIQKLPSLQSKKTLAGVRLRITAEEPISQLEVRQLNHELRDTRDATEIVFKAETTNKQQTAEAGNVHIHKASLRNDSATLCKLYREYVKQNAAKHPITESQISLAEQVIRDYVEKLKHIEQDNTARDVTWSIKALEFDNLFRYGEGNKIDFEKLSGVVGIFGPNKSGKSAIIGALMYGLFNTTDRGPIKSAYLINKNKTAAACRLLINVDGVDYYIVREISKQSKRKGVADEEKATSTLNLYRITGDGSMANVSVSTENSESKTDTDKIIRKLIGTSQDFLLTAFANQGGINRFIEEGATERKAILNRFLDLDIFEKLCKFANDDRASLNARTVKFSSVNWELLLFQTKKKVTDRESTIATTQESIELQRKQLEELGEWLRVHESSTTAELNTKKVLATTELAQLQSSVKKLTTRWNELQVELTELEKLSAILEQEIVAVNQPELVAKKDALAQLRARVLVLNTDSQRETLKLDSQKKSVRKLELVPCGEEFPACHFIKDGHEDKKLIEQQKSLVTELVAMYNSVKTELVSLEHEQIDRKLQEYASKKEKLSFQTKNKSSLEREQKLVLDSLTATELAASEKKNFIDETVAKLSMLDNEVFLEKKNQFKMLQTAIKNLEFSLTRLFVDLGGDKVKVEQLLAEKVECQQLLTELKIHESIFHGFSKNGIPAIVLKTQLPALNNELEKVLTNIVDFKVTIETETASNSLDVFIEDIHSRRVIELGSGMEKMIASLALRTALTNMSSLPKPDIFIIDEGWGTLDEEGIQKCMQLLTLFKEQFKTVLVISHIPQVKEAADRIIEIKNNGNESKVEV